MKKSNALLLATTLGCTLLSATVLAAPPMDGDKIKEEVKAMLSQHDEAMNKQDVKALMMF